MFIDRDESYFFKYSEKNGISRDAAEWIYPWVRCDAIVTDQEYAVGLVYKPGKMLCPEIREKTNTRGIWPCLAASRYGVYIAIDEVLAKELYYEYEKGDSIQKKHYKEIADVLAHVCIMEDGLN